MHDTIGDVALMNVSRETNILFSIHCIQQNYKPFKKQSFQVGFTCFQPTEISHLVH